MAERNKRKVNDTSKELSPKEVRLHARQREQDLKLYTYVGAAVGLALLLLLAGAIYTFLWVPRSSFASVGDQSISTQDFWNRMRYEKNSLQGQLAQLEAMEQQFGNQGYFTSQINQAQSTLSSSFALSAQTLDRMLEEEIVLREAAARGITVSDEDVEAALKEEVANQQGLLTEPQATETTVADSTATAEAISAATATAQATVEPAATSAISDTVIPSEAISETQTITGTAAISDTNVVTATSASSDAVVSAEITTTEEISAASDVTQAVDAITSTDVTSDLAASEPVSPTATPEPIPTRAIITETLFADSKATLEANLKEIARIDLDTYRQIIRVRLLRDKLREVIGADVPTTQEEVKARHILLREILPTPEVVITDTVNITPTLEPTALPEGFPTPTPTPAPRTFEEAMAQAQAIKAQIDAGEDFAQLATIYSDDTGSALNGGDLGWFAKGAMVPEFEQQAFSLSPGQVSEPFTTTFGVHILQVEEKDGNRPLDEQAIQQKRADAYQTWLQEQLAKEDVKRPLDLTANLPRDLR